jgi:hypothetical protein
METRRSVVASSHVACHGKSRRNASAHMPGRPSGLPRQKQERTVTRQENDYKLIVSRGLPRQKQERVHPDPA